MRVLIAHSRYLSGDASGENRVVLDEEQLLAETDVKVESWTPEPESGSATALVRSAGSAVWARKAIKELDRRIMRFRPDVVHVHNVFPVLSPAVLRIPERHSIPVVMTLHNYRLMCPSGVLMRDGHLCEDCLGRAPVPAVRHRCFRGSAVGSAVIASSLVLHRSLHTFDHVTRFVAVSDFVKQKHVQAGIQSDRISVRHNFSWPMSKRQGAGDYFLYLGRLSPEKGIDTLLKAWSATLPELRVVGDGPLMDDLRAQAGPNVRFVGPVDAAAVPSILMNARALLLPSRWYEGSPRSISEAFAAGVPVLASRIGALTEMIEDGRTGLVLEVDDPDSWRDGVVRLCADDVSIAFGDAAHIRWAERYSPDVASRSLIGIYESVT